MDDFDAALATAAGFVLAGGASTRMGRNKALLNFAGEPLACRAARLVREAGLAVRLVGPPELYHRLGLETIADDRPGLGPLGAIATALAHSDRPWNLIVAVDLPHLTAGWLRALVARAAGSKADALVPRSDRGLEPLCAVYHRRCLPSILAALDRGVRKVTGGLDGPPPCRVEEIAPAEWKGYSGDADLFENINTPAEYRRARPGELG
ncbi:MAG TPA: molybdenum cofactor guanylyltransferase [Candidatus Acidoferrales bacterium]|nr:molybdenum cofactor guanylyltransferase [Candidatus Acidoferrales bacterium]